MAWDVDRRENFRHNYVQLYKRFAHINPTAEPPRSTACSNKQPSADRAIAVTMFPACLRRFIYPAGYLFRHI